MNRLFTSVLLCIAGLLTYTSKAQVTIQVGTATTVTGGTIVSPVNNYWRNYRIQILYTVAELNALGILCPQTLDQIGFNVVGLPTVALPNWTIKIKTTNVANLTTYDPGPFTTVYTTPTNSPVAGWNSYTFNAPWSWNGIDNILIDICWDIINPTYYSTGTVQYTAATNRMLYFNSDNIAACPSVTGSSSSNRPNTQLRFTPAPACTGSPAGGVASLLSNCPTSAYTAKLVNYPLVCGLAFQWQSRLVCNGTWTNISGATLPSYNISSIPAPSEFRIYTVCTGSNQTDTSNVLTVTSLTPCYCTSNATNASGSDIFSVSVNGVTNTSNCTSIAPGAGSQQNQYSNYVDTIPAIRLSKGNAIPFTISTGACPGAAASGIAIWIDYNRNGTFDFTEKVYSSPASVLGAHTEFGGFVVPQTASEGLARMRIVNQEIALPNSISACGTYTYGETEDYLVNILYAPTVTGDTIYCSGEDAKFYVTATALTSPTYIWTGPNGFTSTADTISFPNVDTAKRGVYTVRAISASACAGGADDTSGVTKFRIYVNQTPPPPSVASVINYCVGNPFDSISIYGLNIKWFDAMGNLLSMPPTVNTSILGSDTFYASQTSLSNCESERAQVIINVVPPVGPPTVTSPIVYCQGDATLPLQANGSNLLFYNTPIGGIGTPVTPSPSSFAQGTFTYYVSQSLNGCESIRVPIVVNVNYRPNAYISVSRPYVCQYDTISINYFGNAIPTATYTYTFPTGATQISGSGQGPVVVRFDSAGVRRVTLLVDNGGCTGPLATADITVRLSPRLTLDVPKEICVDQPTTLSVAYATPGIDTFFWDFAGGDVLFGAEPGGKALGPFGLVWHTPGDKIITAIASDRGDDAGDLACLSLPVSETITVHDRPVADILNFSSNKVCTGDSILFTAYFDPNYSYQWLPSQFFNEQSQYNQYGVIDYSRVVTLNVTNQFNCKSSDSIAIDAAPCCEVTFPTAFSPNGDGRNDYFRAIGLGNHKITNFRIQNRWGQVVYENADPDRGWDGTFAGKQQDMGTFFYYVKFLCSDGKYYEQKGEVVLVR